MQEVVAVRCSAGWYSCSRTPDTVFQILNMPSSPLCASFSPVGEKHTSLSLAMPCWLEIKCDI